MLRKLAVSVLVVSCSLAFAQKDPYRVLAFPPFAAAPTTLEVTEDRGDTVLVRHAYGETEIPKNPGVYTTPEVPLPLERAADTITLERK